MIQRVAVQQTCPVLSVIAEANCFAVASRSTSSKMTAAPLPPSSNLQGIKLSAQASAICFPVAGEPVNDIRWMPGQSLTHTGPISQHYIQHAFRKPNLLRNLTYEKRTKRSYFRGFYYHS